MHYIALGFIVFAELYMYIATLCFIENKHLFCQQQYTSVYNTVKQFWVRISSFLTTSVLFFQEFHCSVLLISHMNFVCVFKFWCKIHYQRKKILSHYRTGFGTSPAFLIFQVDIPGCIFVCSLWHSMKINAFGVQYPLFCVDNAQFHIFVVSYLSLY